MQTLVEQHLGVTLPKEVEVHGKQVRLSYGEFKDKINEAPDAYFHYNAFDTIAQFYLCRELIDRANELASRNGVQPELILSHSLQVKAALSAAITSRRSFALDEHVVQNHKSQIEQEIKHFADLLENKYSYSPGTGSEVRFNSAAQNVERDFGIKLERQTNKSGKVTYSKKAEDLEKFDNEFCKTFVDQQRRSKMLSNFINPYIDKKECHPQIDILKTTGRIGMRNPALQTIPKSTAQLDLRQQFVARPGHTLVICDFVCAELVTLAQVCLDLFGHSHLAEILNAGEDVHRSTAAAFFGKNPLDISSLERTYGKIANFGLPGGMGAESLVRNAKTDYGVDLSVDEARLLRQAWLETYPEMKEYLALPNLLVGQRLDAHPYPARERPIDSKIAVAIFAGIISGNFHTRTTNRPYRQDEIEWAWNVISSSVDQIKSLKPFLGQITNRQGSRELERAFRSTLVSVTQRSGRVRANCGYTDFCNNPFQSLLADVTKLAWFELHKHGHAVVHVIHDKLVCEIQTESDENIKVQTEKIERILVDAASEFCPDVKMRVETRVSRCWGKDAGNGKVIVKGSGGIIPAQSDKEGDAR